MKKSWSKPDWTASSFNIGSVSNYLHLILLDIGTRISNSREIVDVVIARFVKRRKLGVLGIKDRL